MATLSVVPAGDGLGTEGRSNASSRPRWLMETRSRYRRSRKAGRTAFAIADAQLAYAYALQVHVHGVADVSDDARASLNECIRLLEEALQVPSPVSVVREQVESLDEEIMFIEVCLDSEMG